MIKQLDCPLEQRELLVGEYRVRDALVVQVADPIARQQEDSESDLLQLTEQAPYDFSK